jgi:hypothetical protein
MTKTSKPRQKGLQNDDSKPAMLAKLIFPAIVRMIRSRRSAAVEKSSKFLLDSEKANRICVHRG